LGVAAGTIGNTFTEGAGSAAATGTAKSDKKNKAKRPRITGIYPGAARDQLKR
jgi:hypothetical protein